MVSELVVLGLGKIGKLLLNPTSNGFIFSYKSIKPSFGTIESKLVLEAAIPN